MSGGQWVWWAAWLAGVVFSIGMLWLARWALFGDKARGRQRCPRCWYDMTESPTLTCSECGHETRYPSQLRRTRRRWVIGVLAILCLTAGGSVLIQSVNEYGWAKLIPNRVLLLAVPFDDLLGEKVMAELSTRMQRGQLSGSELASFVDRWVTGDFRARPPGDEWIARYGKLVWQWRDALPSANGLHDRLANLPVRIDLTSRESWPAGSMPVAMLEMRRWWPSDQECRLRMTPRVDGAKSTTLYHGGRPGFRGRLAIPLPPLTEPVSQVTCDVVVEQRTRTPGAGPVPGAGVGAGANEWKTMETHTFSVRWRTDPAASVMEAVDGPAAESVMRQVFSGEIAKWSSGRSPVRLRYLPWNTAGTDLDGVAIGVVVDLLRDGKIARRLNLWWRGDKAIPREQWQFGSELPQEDPPLLMQANGEDSRWTMRIASDPDLALRIEGATRFWSGQITIPLSVRAEDGAAPPPAWWVEEE